MTTIELTDSQIVLAGWDRKTAVKYLKGRRRFMLTDDEVEELRIMAETLSWGSDPSTMTSAKALLRKLDASGVSHDAA